MLFVSLLAYIFTLIFIIFLFIWLCPVACGILVPQPGIKPAPPALEVWSLNHWTTREVPAYIFNIKSD